MTFGIPDRAIDVVIHTYYNCIHEESKHSDDSMVTGEVLDSQLTSKSPVNIESTPVLKDDHAEGEHLILMPHDHIHDSTVVGEHDQNTQQFEGEYLQENDEVEGENLNSSSFVEGELNWLIPDDLTN